MREPLKIKNGAHVVVSNQWGGNIENFIEVSTDLGFNITKTAKQSSTVNSILEYLKNLNGSDFSLSAYVNKVNTLLEGLDLIDNETHQELIEAQYEELLELVGENPNRYGGCVYIFKQMVLEKSEHEVWLDFDFDIISDNSYSLQKLLDEGTPVKIVCKDYSENDFKPVFISKFIFTLLNIIDETDDYELIAELIVASNINDFTNPNTTDSFGGDWISDMVIEILKILGCDIQDYEGEVEIEGRYFMDMGEHMGYDYVKLAEDFRDSNI